MAYLACRQSDGATSALAMMRWMDGEDDAAIHVVLGIFHQPGVQQISNNFLRSYHNKRSSIYITRSVTPSKAFVRATPPIFSMR